jgi:hypothetical protein
MMPMDFSIVLDTFASPLPITVTDTVGAYVDGRWTLTESEPRTITGIVLATVPDALQFLKEGESSQPGIAIHTRDTLYYSDIDDSAPDGQETRQSFVTYDGLKYRVNGSGTTFSGNVTSSIYNAVRWFE